MKVAVLTPFCSEPAQWLETAAASVRRQIRIPQISEIRHLMIFDGADADIPAWEKAGEHVIAVGYLRTPEQKSLSEAAGLSGCGGVKIRQR